MIIKAIMNKIIISSKYLNYLNLLNNIIIQFNNSLSHALL